jgi:hypothetical protein
MATSPVRLGSIGRETEHPQPTASGRFAAASEFVQVALNDGLGLALSWLSTFWSAGESEAIPTPLRDFAG